MTGAGWDQPSGGTWANPGTPGQGGQGQGGQGQGGFGAGQPFGGQPAHPYPPQPNPTQQLPGVPVPGAYGQPYPPGGPYSPAGGYGSPGAYPTAGGYDPHSNAGQAPSTTGIAVSSVGAAIALLGTFLSWYAAGSVSVSLKDIVSATGRSGAPGFAHLYFGWALWVVLAIAICVAVAANVVRTSVAAAAVVGAVVAVASPVLTYAALNSAQSSGGVFDHAAIGLWLVITGPVVLAVGSLLGLSRAPAS